MVKRKKFDSVVRYSKNRNLADFCLRKEEQKNRIKRVPKRFYSARFSKNKNLVKFCLEKEEQIVKSFSKLIYWAGNRFAFKLKGRYTFSDFFEEGFLTLSLCLFKWRIKDPTFERLIEFNKYFKTSLFNKFRQIQILSCSRKKFGINVSISVLAHLFVKKKEGVYTDSPLGKDLLMDSFDEVRYKELISHISANLDSGLERLIFELHVNPPKSLLNEILLDCLRKEKKSVIVGGYVRRIKLHKDCLYRYFVNTYNDDYGFLDRDLFFKNVASTLVKVKNLI